MNMSAHFNNIWTKLDLMQTPSDINKNIGKSVYVVFEDDDIIASTRKYDIDCYLKERDLLEKYSDDAASVEIIYGLVLNPKELPEDTPKMDPDFSIYVIYYDNGVIDFRDVDDINEVTDYVESILAYDDSIDINDISIIYGTPVKMLLQTAVVEKVVDTNTRKGFLVYGSGK